MLNNYTKSETVQKWIKEDVPYFDLTTHLLGIGDKKGRMTYTTRHETCIAGVEEAIKIAKELDLKIVYNVESGKLLSSGEKILEVEGQVARLHQAWRVILNVLEYTSGIATRTYKFLEAARKGNPHIQLLSTRKVFPGTKELSIKGVLAGGGYPHRLGLSETILIFDHHLNFFDNLNDKKNALLKIKKEALEKKVTVEAGNMEEAKAYASVGVDALQIDKMSTDALNILVSEVKAINSHITLIATGGVTIENAEAYGRTGVDAIVTTSMYFGKPADIGVSMVEIKV